MSKTPNPLLNALIKTSGNKYATIADDGIVAGDIVSFIGTGSYVLNALVSGSIFGGLPSNRITGFSAESSTGKCARGTEKIKVYFKTSEERDAFLARCSANGSSVTISKSFALLSKGNRMFECEVTYKELVDAMAPVREVGVEAGCEFEAFVRVPDEGEFAPIIGVIEKAPTHLVRVEFADGSSFECAETHLFSRLGMPVPAAEADVVDTIYGELAVLSSTPTGEVEPVYDISIPSPHWYVAGENGVIHHNTFLVLGAVKEFLGENPEGIVCLFESESAISRDMLIGRGIDVDRVAVFPVTTVEEFRNSSLRIVEQHMALPEKERPKIMFVLDSLGMLSTDKEIKEAVAGTDTKDMTRAQLIKSTFRVLTLKLGHCNIPLAITNHVYAAIGSNSPLPESGGGSGFKYAVSTEITLTKAQYKEGEEQVGIVVTAKAKKSRLTVENTKVKVLIRYDGGLDPYYGLVPIVEAMGVIKKEMGRFVLPDGKKVFEKNIVDNPQMLYTPELLKQIDEWVKKNFTYGSNGSNQGLNLSGEPDKEEKAKA